MTTIINLKTLYVIIATFMIGSFVIASEDFGDAPQISETGNSTLQTASTPKSSNTSFKKIIIRNTDTTSSIKKSNVNSAITPARYQEMLTNKEGSSMLNFFPFFIIIAGWFLFRGEQETIETPTANESRTESPSKSSLIETKTSTPAPVSKVNPPQARAASNLAAKKTETSLIDLSIDAGQCQAETAKGTRCSRTVNLETIVVTIKNKLYQFATCKQHNRKSFKPHPKVLKKAPK